MFKNQADPIFMDTEIVVMVKLSWLHNKQLTSILNVMLRSCLGVNKAT